MSKKLMYLLSVVLVMGLAFETASAQPINQDPGSDGIVSVEAEHYDHIEPGQNGTGWEEVGPKDGFTGEIGMEVLDEGTNNTNYAAESSRLDYEINFVKTGTYYVWILAWGVDGGSDSCHSGLDGEEIDTCDRMSGWNGDYEWNSDTMDPERPTFEVTTPGVHTFNVWMREDNLVVDKIVLTTNPDFTLSGTEPGPPESSRGARVVAFSPTPTVGATDVPRDVTLGWEAGEFAASHDVYFGSVFDDINDADRTDPRGVLAKQGQPATSYTPPQRLDFATTYYWRIDEVNAPPSNMVHKGDVWSFTTELFSYPVTDIFATASSSAAEKGPENVVNGSGLDSSGLHGNAGEGNMWLSDIAGPQPTWILFEFDTIHKLHEMHVWNSNESLETVIGLGFKDVTIEHSIDGVDFAPLGTTHEFAQGAGSADYAHNTTIDLSGVPAKYVRLTANSNWGGFLPQFGLSEVQFFSLPVQAREPNPAYRAREVALDLDLSWRAGREASVHDVYFSDDWQAVVDSTAAATAVTETSYGPVSLDLGKTYYWRVDEVNDSETPSTWQGNIWSFTTHEYFVVDDFESYNDIDEGEPDSNRIYIAWADGYDDPANGSQVGHLDPPFAEQTIVNSDKQSMPFFYDNSVGNSEATMTLSSLRDWTIRGAGELSLWFRGNPTGLLEEPAGTFTMSAEGADIWNTADEFRYVYKQLSGAGSISAQILSVENTNNWAKCGVMIRQSLDAGSKFAAVYITPTNADGTATNGCRFQGRLTPGADAVSDTSVATDEQKAITVPYWIKLERDAADNFNGYYSSDGVNWQAMSWNPRKISMPQNVYIGLAFTSHNSGVTGEAQISDVTTAGAVSPLTWSHEAIGVEMASNEAEPMYVAAGGNAVVEHDNPNASLINDWTQWNIDLTRFADQGVNLANVNTVTIGFGDKKNPQAGGGSGLVYFDDVRLYPHREPPVQVPKEVNIIFEAESADTLGTNWRLYRDPASLGTQHIGSDDGDGNDNDTAPGAEWVAVYNFTATAEGVYKILLRGQEAGADSFWVRITTATSQTLEDPDQPGTGWVRFNGMEAPNGWTWDEVHSDDDPDDAVVNWTLAAGEHTLEIAKREDGVLLDAVLITDDLDLDQMTLP